MANNLTGDFDVVAEFALPGANRVLAAMHQCERFLHSISVRVDDNSPAGSQVTKPTMVGVADTFGGAVANQRLVTGGRSLAGAVVASDPLSSMLGQFINPNLGGFVQGINPSHLQGVAQLQLFPPTVDVLDATGKNVTVTINTMARYFPDPKTAALAEFMRGDLQITAPVNQIASQMGQLMEFDFKADQASVNFTPSYSSQSLSPQDIAAINLAVQNALKTSFLSSSASLPSGVAQLEFKSLLAGGQKALAVLLNTTSRAADSGSVGNVFLGAADDFAFAIGADFINSLFTSHLDAFTQIQPFKVHIWVYGTTTYTITPTAPPTIALQNGSNGSIVVTLKAHAHSSKDRFPSFDFEVKSSFTLNLVPIGAQGRLGAAELALANVSIDFQDSGIGGWIKDELLSLFQGPITDQIESEVNDILNPADPQPTDLQPIVRQTTNVDAVLGNFLNQLLQPADGSQTPPNQSIKLAYTSFEIGPAGLVLHGSLSLLDWPAAYVEFEQIPSSSSGPGGLLGGLTGPPQGPDYSALKTWIPGGRIDQYEWSVSYQNQLYSGGADPNKFVLLHSGWEATDGSSTGTLPPYSPLCLTARGTRLAPSGPAVAQPVSATVCGSTKMPIFDPGTVTSLGNAVPMLALTRPGPRGKVVVSGHAAAQAAKVSGAAPNLIIHFADAKSAGEVRSFMQALQQSQRTNAAAAVVAVMAAEQLAKEPYQSGVIYSDDLDGSWEKMLGIKAPDRPVTLIVSPQGKVMWRHRGSLDGAALTTALREHLASTAAVPVTLSRITVRPGRPAPNFLFEYTPGRLMPLSKLRGRPVVMAFWKSSLPPSVAAVRALTGAAGKTPTGGTVVLAIQDGESPEPAPKSGLAAVVVGDPKRQISGSYGVNIWPTIVSLDAAGMITGIAYGYAAGEPATSGSRQTAADAR